MRAVIVSGVYADPASRGKLRALAGLGVGLAAAVPDRWTPPGLLRPQKTTWGDDGGVRVVPVPVRGRVGAGADPEWKGTALRRLMADFRPDLVQIEEEPWSRAAAAAARAARRLRIPYVVVARESIPVPHGLRGGYRRSRVLGGAAGLIGVNELALRLAARGHAALPQRTLLQLGVQPPAVAPRTSHGPLAIGFFGRLIPEKGLDLLFRAAVKLLGRWTVTVVGTGPAQEELESLAERLGIAGRVTWLGALPRPAVEDVWPRLDCVVAPSRTAPRWVEVAPRAVLEAMARGLPVIASASGALPEILGPGGTIVAEEDVPALTAALQRFHDEPAERARLGAAGRQRVLEQFSDRAVAAGTLDFWTRLTRAIV